MCKTCTTQEKKVIGIFTIANAVGALYPAYGLYKSVSAYVLANRVADCVCTTLSNATSHCASSITTLIGPGLSITNATVFCKEASSSVNVALSNATYEIVVNSLLAGAVLGGGAYMTYKAIKNMRQQQAELNVQAY